MVRFSVGIWIVALVSHAAGCAPAVRTRAPLFDGLGAHHRAITTASPLTQRYFDQGLVWAYAFNHDEAIRSFRAALEHDPNCALAWWGIALCNGPHINNPVMDAPRSAAAWEALQRAQALAPGSNPVEIDLIAALACRYADPPPADRRPLDEAHALAMKGVWTRHAHDADVGTLYAEALLDLQPWDLWTKDGQAKGNTPEILAVLERVLELDENHPGANHLYIHAVEASPHPERGDSAATRLRTAVPLSGHLVHMPAHIDVQLGRWSLAADQNVQAIAADRRYRKLSPHQAFYRVYLAHNHHFLAFASMMEGRSAVALRAARDMIAGVPAEFVRENGAWVDPYMSIALDVLKRFGRWHEILREPPPPVELPITTAFWHFSRGIAHAALGQVADAERELAAFRIAANALPPDTLMAINPAPQVLSIADHMLVGEIAFRRGDIDGAVSALRRAVALEDDLLYMEPPDWIQPVRHTLGAILVHAGRFAEAERVYRDDLTIWPENGWSLHGLATCLRSLGKEDEAAQVEQRFARSWSRADVKIGASCLCVATARRR